MDETVTKLVKELAESVRKHTKGLHPDVNEALKSVQDYVAEATASKTVVEDKLKLLEDKLSDKKLMKKPCKDVIEKIRAAMRVQRKAVKKETHPKDKKRDENPPKTTHLEDKRAESTTTAETAKVSGSVEQKMQEHISRLETENQNLRDNLDRLHETAQNKLRKPQETKGYPTGKPLEEENITEVARLTKTEAEYMACLLEELNKYSGCDDKLDTAISLTEPPLQKPPDSSNDGKKTATGKKDAKNQNDENVKARHNEQLQKYFASASIVLEKLMEAEYMASLLEELNKYSGCDCKLDTAISLTESPLQKSPDSSNDGKKDAAGKKDAKKQKDENVKARHNEQLQKKFASASIVLDKLIELNIVYGRISQISSLLSGNEGGYLPQSTPNVDQTIATGRKGRRIPSQPNDQSQQTVKFEKDVDLITSTLHYLKDKERKHNDLDRKAKQVDEMTVKLQLLRDDNDKIKKEADSLRTRLSEQVGLAVTHENPAITDLSDPNRPTKLAEQYSELYDNQWTDAFEILSKNYPKKSESKITGHLYEMLVDSYNFCEKQRQKQKQDLEGIMLYPAGSTQSSQGSQKNEDINRIFAKILTDAAKLTGNVTGANIAKIFLMSETTKEKYQEWTKRCETYIECCVRLCWLMQVQTPPLCLDLKTVSGKTFDKNCYREYLKGGKRIAFVVWPAMFLHENGPTLCKGIAQGQ